MAIYETIFIIDSLVPPNEIEQLVQRFSTVISDHGGKVLKVDKWGKRRLAYEIEKKQYGYYAAIEFEGEGNIPKELEHEYNYNDRVMRYLTYRYDKNKLKMMAEAEKKEKAPRKEPVGEKQTEVKEEAKPVDESQKDETPEQGDQEAPNEKMKEEDKEEGKDHA